jgi:hypothetical protein
MGKPSQLEGWATRRLAEHGLRSTNFERELERLSARRRIHADVKVPNATVVVTGLKPVIDTWTLSADCRTLTHDSGDHKEIYIYEKQ